MCTVCTNFSGTFLILRITQRDIITNVQYIYLHAKFPLLLQILMRLEMSRKIFKNKNTKFYEDPSIGRRVPPCGWTHLWRCQQTHFATLQTGLKWVGLYIHSPTPAIYGHGQHWIHISYFIWKIVFHILVRRYYSSLRPYIMQILQKKSVPTSERNQYSI
jgi:hypothetical protein